MTASANHHQTPRRLARLAPRVPPARARALRAGLERALDAEGWPWLPEISLLLDAVLIAGEAHDALR